jgi:hypothetical protein
MSLVGSLEDLALADILQIVSLARKSGRLLLRSEDGEGWIALHDGLVRGAAVKGQREGLRALLVKSGGVDPEVFERAAAAARGEEAALEAALLESGALSSDSLQQVKRESVERAVMRMFGWRTGEFRFEVGDGLDVQGRGVLLEKGLNTQYLAMEATRLGDEQAHGELPEPAPRGEPASDALLFSGESEPVAEGERVPGVEATHALAFASAGRADVPPEEPDVVGFESAAAEIPVSEQASAPARIAVRVDAASPESAATTPSSSDVQLVAIDADLGALEWLKASLEGLFRRIHIFQHAGIAMERIRQYLRRGELPVVVISSRMTVDRSGDVAPPKPLVKRLRALAPRMPLVALVEADAEDEAPPGVDAVVVRPLSPGLDPAAWEAYRPAAQRVREALAAFAGGGRGAGRRPALAGLKAVSERLRDPATQGDILELVLDFAAESFSRVAMFMLRDDVVEGIASRRLSLAEGPAASDLQSLRFEADARPELMSRVLAERQALRAAPQGPRDRAFLSRLGPRRPREVYLAPIESGGGVVALLYADNLPVDGPLGDTTALEIVLHEAGLALDRAVLERALSEA